MIPSIWGQAGLVPGRCLVCLVCWELLCNLLTAIRGNGLNRREWENEKDGIGKHFIFHLSISSFASLIAFLWWKALGGNLVLCVFVTKVYRKQNGNLQFWCKNALVNCDYCW